MTGPHFVYRLCICVCTALLWGVGVATAQQMGPGYQLGQQQEIIHQAKQTAGDIDSKVTTDGACDFDDDAKKKMAQKAAQALKETRDALIEFNKIMIANFKDENGSCHYLDNRLTDGTFSDDANRYVLLFTDYAKAGASNANKLYPSGRASELLSEYDSKLTYAGIDVRKLTSRTTVGDSEIVKMVNWAQTAKQGSTFQINEAASELLEEAFGFKADCNYAIMTDNNGSFTCYQINEADGEAFNKAVEQEIESMKKTANQSVIDTLTSSENCTGMCLWNQLTGLIGGGVIELLKQTGALTSFSCTKDKCVNGGQTYESLGAAVNGLTEQAAKCNDDLAKAAEFRDELINKRKEADGYLAVLSGNLNVYCTCEMHNVDGTMEATGKVQDCYADDPDFIEDNMTDDCYTIAEYQTKMTGEYGERCVTCRLFHTILKAVQNLAQKAYDALAPAFSKLVGIGFGIYIAYITLLAVAAPAAQKISQYLTNLTTQGIRVLIALTLLATPGFVYGTIIGPIIDGGVDFGITLAGSDKAAIQEMGAKFEFDPGNTYLQAGVLQNTVGAAAAFNKTASLVPAIGRSLMCHSWYRDEGLKELVTGSYHFFPNIPMWLEGLILYIFGLMIAFAVGFYMIDCALQLGVVCAMMPFFIASWPFKITKSYTKQGWDVFLNTFFNFVVMGVVISATSQIMIQALSTGLSEQTLGGLLNSNQVEELMKEIEFGGLQMAMLVICCMLALKMSGEIQNITNKLSGGLGISVGAGLGGTMGSMVKKGAVVAAGAAGTAAGAAGMRALEASGAAGAARALTGKAKNTATEAAGNAGMGSQAFQSDSGRDHGQHQQFGETGNDNSGNDNNEETPSPSNEGEDNNGSQ